MKRFRWRAGIAAATAGGFLIVPATAQAANGDLLHRGADVDTKTWHVTYKGAKAVTLTAKGSASASYYVASYLEGDLCSKWRPREWWSFPALMFSVLTADVKAIVRRSVRTV